MQLNHAELVRRIEAQPTHGGQHSDNLAILYVASAQIEAVAQALITLFLEDTFYACIFVDLRGFHGGAFHD